MTNDLITTKARTRIRRRTALAAVLAALVVFTAVAVSLRISRPDVASSSTPREKPGITLRTDPLEPATPEEIASREKRLQAQMITAFGRILPEGWEHSTFDFDCDQSHCWAEGDIIDSAGTVKLSATAWADLWAPDCHQPKCRRKILADGTLVSFTSWQEDGGGPVGTPPARTVEVVGFHPDNSTMSLSAEWPPERATPPLPDDQWTRFATAITY